GIGEVYAAAFGARTLPRMVEEICERHVVGRDPTAIELLWREVYARGYSMRPDVSLVAVLSAVETACWDILGKAVGRPVYELFGAHGQFTASGAIRLAKRLEQFDPLWFEEPTPPELPEQMARVACGTSIPIATGERLATKYEFARVLELGAASILQMNLGRVGGLLEAKKIAGMAEAHYAQIAPHLYCGPVEGAANIQIAACSPNFLILESIQNWGGFHAEI